MLAEIELEALRYLDRTTLDGLRMHSRYLRDVVDRHARTLPLRYIHEVEISNGVLLRFHFCVIIQPREKGPSIMLPASEELYGELIYHISNAFIHRFVTGFRQNDVPPLHYLQANADGLQCQINALRIKDWEETIDYALVDFMGVRLQPRTLETLMYHEPREDYAKLFTHSAARPRCPLGVYEGRAPDCIIPDLFDAGTLETCAITTYIDPRPWIGKFLETFETAERGKDTIQSVTLIHVRTGSSPPVRHNVDPLGQPRRTNVPAPLNAFVKEWARKERTCKGRDATESTVAELFVFENAKSAKKLELFVWTVQYEQYMLSNYAFLLQVSDI